MLRQATAKTIGSTNLHERSVYLVNELANAIRRNDNGERLASQTEIQRAGITCSPFWEQPGDPEGDCYQQYIETHPKFSLSVRTTVLELLVQAQQQLPANWQIVLKSGYRPYQVQMSLLDMLTNDAMVRHPEWTHKQALQHARTFVSDPSLVCPPHVTGGAIDIDIIDRFTGLAVDMGCPPNTDTEAAFLHSTGITTLAQAHRQRLLNTMLDVGFAPLASEWWHYQYGDTYWAAFYGHRKTIYDLLK